MIDSRQLQRLSVRDCFGQFAWQGAQAVLAIKPAAVLRSSWQTTAVQTFFGQYNWAGRTRTATTLGHPTPGHTMLGHPTLGHPIEAEFTVTLPVQQFFNCFAWAGRVQIAPQPVVEIEPQTSPVSDFKLSNFANLF
jgi:hypothetical protein